MGDCNGKHWHWQIWSVTRELQANKKDGGERNKSEIWGSGIFEGVGFNRGLEITGFDKIEMEESYFLNFLMRFEFFAG